MNKSKKKFKWWILILCAILLAIIVFLTACIAPYFAHRGQIGPDVYYAFNRRTGTAVIYGKGSTYIHHTHASYYATPPMGGNIPDDLPAAGCSSFEPTLRYQKEPGSTDWSRLAWDSKTVPLRKVIVLPGVTGLDTGLLQDCVDLREVYLPDTIVNFAAKAINADGNHGRTPLTIYFDGDAPCITFGEAECPPDFGLYDVTIVHRPNAAGWEYGYSWWNPAGQNEDQPYYVALETRGFSINWLPLLG